MSSPIGNHRGAQVQPLEPPSLTENELRREIEALFPSELAGYEVPEEFRYLLVERWATLLNHAHFYEASHSFMLTNVPFSESSFAAFLEALGRDETLEVLSLTEGTLSSAQVNALAPTIAEHPSLRELNLSRNQSGQESINAILTAVGEHPTIKILQIANAEVNSSKELLAALSTLHKLNAEENQIDDEGAIAIADAIGKNEDLLEVKIGGNAFGESGRDALESAERRSPLCEVSFKSSQVPTEMQRDDLYRHYQGEPKHDPLS